jgi:hypothetical protein
VDGDDCGGAEKPTCQADPNDLCKLGEAQCINGNTWTCEIACDGGKVCKSSRPFPLTVFILFIHANLCSSTGYPRYSIDNDSGDISDGKCKLDENPCADGAKKPDCPAPKNKCDLTEAVCFEDNSGWTCQKECPGEVCKFQ